MVQLYRKGPLAYIFKSHVNFIAQKVDTSSMEEILPLGAIIGSKTSMGKQVGMHSILLHAST